MRDLKAQASSYFETIEKDESDMMNQTKNYANRLRLQREVDFTEDFKKRFMTKDYGNYEKYEKNSINIDLDKGQNDDGTDTFWKNHFNVNKRMKTHEGEDAREQDKVNFEDLL